MLFLLGAGLYHYQLYTHSPDVANLGPVTELPAIGGFVFPADVAWVFPQ